MFDVHGRGFADGDSDVVGDGRVRRIERALIRERQREGIALAKQRGAYRGRKPALSDAQVADLRRRVDDGEHKARIARELGISRETLYQYLRSTR
jgi:DNA invertase Pin-like site-specific DNA recombinase